MLRGRARANATSISDAAFGATANTRIFVCGSNCTGSRLSSRKVLRTHMRKIGVERFQSRIIPIGHIASVHLREQLHCHNQASVVAAVSDSSEQAAREDMRWDQLRSAHMSPRL